MHRDVQPKHFGVAGAALSIWCFTQPVSDHMGAVWALCALQVCGAGYVLDLQLPSGSAHVVLLSLLLLLANLKEQAATLLGPADSGSAKVLLRLPVQVRRSTGLRWGPVFPKQVHSMC